MKSLVFVFLVLIYFYQETAEDVFSLRFKLPPVTTSLTTQRGPLFRLWMSSALFDAKNSGFFEIYDVSIQTRELSQCGQFADKGRKGVNFSQFCVGVLHGRPLILFL